jgi:hypothetical protein
MFVILDYMWLDGDKGEYFSIRVQTPTDERYRLSDGSTGIAEEIMAEHRKRHGGETPEKKRTYKLGMVCRKGLTRSAYQKTLDNGKVVDGVTFYINTSAVKPA